MNAKSRRQHVVSGCPTDGLLCIAFVMIAALAAISPQAIADTVGINTRFDYVAKFPASANPAQIEEWRSNVLGRPQKHACVGGRACIARMMRLALPGLPVKEVIAFDLMPDTPDNERTAITAAALSFLPGTTLFTSARPVDLGTAH